eukprot:scaffold18639_cov57-Phaeocystis_antarctica.AAC.1
MHAEETRIVVGHRQGQPLGLRLLQRLLARQRWGRRSLLCRRLPLRRTRHAQRRLLGGGEAAQVHVLATAPHLRLVGVGLAARVEFHAEVTRLVVGHAQRQPLRLRLLQRLLARQRRWCSPLRRRLPLRRPRHAQCRLFGGGEVTQAQFLATAAHVRHIGSSPSRSCPRAASAPPPAPAAAPPRSSAAAPLQPSPPPPSPPAIERRIAPPLRRAPHFCLEGLGAGHAEDHAEVARRVVGHEEHQPLHLRLLPRVLARQRRRRRCNPLRRRSPLRRPRDAQRRPLGGGEAAQVRHLATAPHVRLIGLGLRVALVELHAVVTRLVAGHEQRQTLRATATHCYTTSTSTVAGMCISFSLGELSRVPPGRLYPG